MGHDTKRGTIGLLGLAIAAAGLLGVPAAKAQAYPAKPIKFIVSSQAGGVVDIRARRIGAR